MSQTQDSSKAFLDTTIILTREFGSRPKKEEIRSALKEKSSMASTYSITEINRTFLKDAIFLYSVLTDEPTLHAVFERLQKFPMTERRIKRCLAILDKITDSKQLHVKTAMSRLENLISGTKSSLFRDVFIIESGTLCPLSQETVEFDYPTFKLYTSCTKSSAKCSLAQYLNSYISELSNLQRAISSHSKMKNMFMALEKVIADPHEAKGRRCQTLGDVIICLDAPEGCDVYSTNAADFAVICGALKKKFVKI